MSESLSDLLASRKKPDPPEIAIIKNFIQDAFQENCEVLLQQHQIVISVRGAALAGALRPKLPQLQAQLNQPNRRLIIRIK